MKKIFRDGLKRKEMESVFSYDLIHYDNVEKEIFEGFNTLCVSLPIKILKLVKCNKKKLLHSSLLTSTHYPYPVK